MHYYSIHHNSVRRLGDDIVLSSSRVHDVICNVIEAEYN